MTNQLTLEQRSDIAYHISSSHPSSNDARKLMAEKYELNPIEVDIISQQYWARWHQLRSIRQLRPNEVEEYKAMLRVVARLDVVEEEQANRLIAKSEEQLKKTKESLKPLEDVIKKSIF